MRRQICRTTMTPATCWRLLEEDWHDFSYPQEGSLLFYFTDSSTTRGKTEQKKQEDALAKAMESMSLADKALIMRNESSRNKWSLRLPSSQDGGRSPHPSQHPPALQTGSLGHAGTSRQMSCTVNHVRELIQAKNNSNLLKQCCKTTVSLWWSIVTGNWYRFRYLSLD